MYVADLALTVERNPESLQVLRRIPEWLGCERVEAESAAERSGILSIRAPTLAITRTSTLAAKKVVLLESGVYTLSFTDLTGVGSRSQVMRRAVDRADDYCGRTGKAAQLVDMVA